MEANILKSSGLSLFRRHLKPHLFFKQRLPLRNDKSLGGLDDGLGQVVAVVISRAAPAALAEGQQLAAAELVLVRVELDAVVAQSALVEEHHVARARQCVKTRPDLGHSVKTTPANLEFCTMAPLNF